MADIYEKVKDVDIEFSSSANMILKDATDNNVIRNFYGIIILDKLRREFEYKIGEIYHTVYI